MKIKRDDNEESRCYWRFLEENSKIVDTWPEWKRGCKVSCSTESNELTNEHKMQLFNDTSKRLAEFRKQVADKQQKITQAIKDKTMNKVRSSITPPEPFSPAQIDFLASVGIRVGSTRMLLRR